ncbi:MAG: hypothetical protein LBP78_06660 [Acidaminococcales bacterium]|jgi:hypothetical protein|nr:hypothetical protein [Acidaminococcales bacterium]
MLEIKNNRIRISRGETAPIMAELDGEIEEGDEITFAVKRNPGDSETLIRLDSGEDFNVSAGDTAITFIIPHAAFDGVPPGTYFYDIRVISGGDWQYIVWPSIFEIVEVVADA